MAIAVSPWVVRALLVGAASWLLAPETIPASLAQSSRASHRLVISITGDVLPESTWAKPHDVEHLLDSVRNEFVRSDLVFLNLEEPITRSETVTPVKHLNQPGAAPDYILRARNLAIPSFLKAAGVGLVGLANNHVMDYTTEGLRETLTSFQEAALPVVGAGLKMDAERAFVFEKHGWRVALLAFSDVVPPDAQARNDAIGIASAKNPADLVTAIHRARQQADFVVLMIHWGGQGKHLITHRQRRLGRVAARAGCDAVVGMHPHVLQGIEYVGRVPVIYSLGNFAFPSRRRETRETVLAKLTFGPRQLERLDFVPVEISSSGAPRIALDRRAKEIQTHLDSFCRMFNTQVKNGKLLRAPVRQELVFDEDGRTSTRPEKGSSVPGSVRSGHVRGPREGVGRLSNIASH